MNIRDKEILHLAVPSIVTNITVPLLGLVDLAIVGHVGNETLIGAIAVGSMIFNVIYWLMGFLRMGTSGMTAQAYGVFLSTRKSSLTSILKNNLTMALLIALAFLVLQWPLKWLSLWLMEPSAGVTELVHTYFNICIWGAPAVLSLY
ncbi:MAG: MATE family efflux transporter, partial [Prevotella sp.]|nr:MATE family efflux transporter [Prevotella sp.]